MSRQIRNGDEIRQSILRGVVTLAEAVTCTLGPKGRNVILERNPMWPPIVTKDGVTVAKEVRDLKDPWENAGANLIREAANKTSDQAGDGTTTATLLAQVIYQRGLEELAKGANPVAIKRGIDRAVALVVEHIASIAQPVNDSETIVRVGTISSNGDRTIGQLIADAMDRVGADGVINVGESNDADTTLKVTEGMQLDRGWLAFPFMTNQERLEAVLDNPYILITERKLFTMTPELDECLAAIAKQGNPVLIVAGDYEQPFIVTLIHNKSLGVLQSVAVKAPAFGDERRVQLEDLAIVTGGYAFTEDCGRPLSTVTVEDFGRAQQVISKGHDSHGSTIIVGGHGTKERIESRKAFLRSLIPATEMDLQREFLKRRLARLSSGVAVIKVGAPTDSERQEKKDRVDDAVCATKAAVEEGIVPGGGKALISASNRVANLVLSLEADERTGAKIILHALFAPMAKILLNAGFEPSQPRRFHLPSWITRRDPNSQILPMLDLAERSPFLNWGYNAATDQWENLVTAGVIDPAKVVRCALQNAASVAALLLTTEAMVATFKD